MINIWLDYVRQCVVINAHFWLDNKTKAALSKEWEQKTWSGIVPNDKFK